jgi:uncharacterized membrane protein
MHGPSLRPTRHQRGSMAVAMMLMLLGLITILGIVEVGYLYWAKRDAQKVADLAALSGAQQLPDCTAATSAASNNAANDNKFSGTLDTNACGTWDPSSSGSKDHFTAGSANANAVKVIAQRPVPSIWGFAGALPNVSAEAVATSGQPIAAFSVSSQLLSLTNNGILPSILSGLGLDVDQTEVLGPDGLANLRITPSGLLKGLCAKASICLPVTGIADVGTLNSTLAAQKVTIGNLLDAMAYLATQQNLADISATLAGIGAKAQVADSLPIQLGSNNVSRGIFALIQAPSAQSALNAQINASDLIKTSLLIADSKHFLDLSTPGGLIPGVTVKVTLIEPPSIAIGGVGATAYTAQLRVYAHIDTSAIPLVGSVLDLIGTKIDIPLIVDITNGHGVLTSLCDTDAQGETATIHTTASLLNLCVGNVDESTGSSTSQPCETDLHSQTLVSILGTPIISGSAHIEGITNDPNDPLSYQILHQGETGSVHVNFSLGDTVTSLMNGILNLLLGNALPADSGQAPAQPDIGTMVNDLWANSGNYSDSPSGRKQRMDAIQAALTKPISSQTTALLPGLLNLVDNLLDSVTNLLGNVLGVVTGDGCTTTVLGIPGGSTAGCKQILTNTLQHNQATSSGGVVSNALLAPLAQIIDLLNPLLNRIGEQVLQPTVTQLLGSDPGRVDVHLQSLQCHRVQLVY